MPFNPDKTRSAGGDAPGWDEPPAPGTYQVELADGDAFTSKRGEDWAKLRWRVRVGHLQGHEWDVLWPLEEDSPRLDRTAKELTKLGVDLDGIADLSELAGAIGQRVGRRYRVAVSQNGNFTNTDTQGQDTQLDLPVGNGAAVEPDLPVDVSDFETQTVKPGLFDDDDIPF